jgi:DNA repair exonuclease SbcCD ATPase subunit
MNEVTLSNNLSQIELEINHHKQIAGQSIWEIGRRLNHVKENDLAHGQFMEWLKKIEFSQTVANQFMKVAKELPNSVTSQNLGINALYLIATLPEEEKQKQIEKIEQGDTPTVRELQEVKKKLKLKEQALEAVKGELERTRLVKPTEKVIEKEVIPDDYKATQELNKRLLAKNKELSDSEQAANERAQFIESQLKELMNQRQEVDEKSAKYDELTRAIEQSQGQLDSYQKQVSAYRHTINFLEKGNNFLANFGGVAFLDIKPALGNPKVRTELETFLTMLNSLSRSVSEILEQDDVIEGEIL